MPPAGGFAETLVYVWRHPRPVGAEGRCIGRTDLPVDPRKARRLAYRIRAFARRHNLPREVVTSPLRRCADVGRILASWGWRHRVDPLLIEADFGRWEGLAWHAIAKAEIDRWCADLLHHAPGGGESLAQLLARVRAWSACGACVVIGHAGWISAAHLLARDGGVPPDFDPRTWPSAPPYGSRTALRLMSPVAAPR